MNFNSLQFAIFLPIVFALYWFVPHTGRWFVLLVSSYYFYMSWNAKYGVLLLAVTILSFGAGLIIDSKEIKKKNVATVVIVSMLLGILFVFKYWNFAVSIVQRVTAAFKIKNVWIPTSRFLLPMGISFYIFQSISYCLDVSRGGVKAERHFGKFAAFISFFPQLVAGPIERTRDLLPQIKKEQKFSYDNASLGLRLMLLGFFKKMALADNLAIWVDRVFDDVYGYHGFSLMLATFAFSIQIYCDFSGYSDIARGVAKLMGINLVENFKSPYLATSINDFWKRWHISLTDWFRDYVYIPLGGSRVDKIRKNTNILITFLVSGLWHGAAGHFVVWGGIHGGYRIVENKITRKRSDKFVSNVIRGVIVFALVSMAWCFFRTGIRESLYVLFDMWAGINHPINYFYDGLVQMNIGRAELIRNFILIGILCLYDAIDKNNDAMLLLSKCNIVVRWIVYYIVFACILIWGLNASSTEFIYFQF